MRFSIAHEFDAPLDAIELAILSPDMGMFLARALAPGVESIETAEHRLEDGVLHRRLCFQASSPLPIFRRYTVPREALAWEMSVVYRIAEHTSTWEVAPKPQYRRYFHASGSSRLEAAPEGRCRRTVTGELAVIVPVPMLGMLVERMALGEVRKTYDAEAETLRSLATL